MSISNVQRHYNKEKHLQFIKNNIENSERDDYSILIDYHIFYERREEILSLCTEFLEIKIDIFIFCKSLINLDFEIDGLGNYKNCNYMDVKCPRDFKNIPAQKRKFRDVCTSISRGIHKQKLHFIKKGDYEVLHLVNFERLIDVGTRFNSQHRIIKGFSNPMLGL